MDLLTTTAAAKALGVNQSRVRQLAIAGTLPATKAGRDWFIAPADIKALKDRRRTAAGRTAKGVSRAK
jgi:excisionase family DNA binding protein